MVTLSASFGAGGSVVGPRVAELLGVEFVDRAIPAEVSERMAIPLEDALAHDDRAAHGLGRVLTAFAHASMGSGWATGTNPLEEHTFRQQAEKVIEERAEAGAVILGRAAALVLSEHETALHVRLHGPEAARTAQAVRIGATTEEDAERTRRDADRARDAYVKHLYGADPADPRHYHLVLDSTAIPLETCAEVIVTAARSRAAA